MVSDIRASDSQAGVSKASHSQASDNGASDSGASSGRTSVGRATDAVAETVVDWPIVRVDWKGPLWLLALVVPVLPFVSLLMWQLSGSAAAWWFTPAFIFGFLPVLDVLLGDDRANLDEGAARRLQEVRYYRWITYAYLPGQYAALVACCAVWVHGGVSLVGRIALVLTAGVVSGVAINTAHELGHKRERVERWLSKVALAATGYGHFYVEHNRGHHVRVATPDDPASARLGESFWAFWPRTVGGSLRSAWRLEAARLRLRGWQPWSWRNHNLRAWALSAILLSALAAGFGLAVVPFVVLQALVGITLLEAVNYLEHYGLSRQRSEAGRYEKVDPRHSWNSDRVVTNVFLFQLQRHSDHHANPLRRYQVLRSFPMSPMLPAGYATMVVVALVPPLWRHVMDKRVLAFYDGDSSRAHVSRN